MSYLKSVGSFVIYVGLFLVMITFMPGLPPHVKFHEYSTVLPRIADLKIQPQNRLRGAERMYVGEIIGAESFDSYNGELYSGIHGGYVIRLEENHVVPIVKFGKECDGIWQEHICGRPLGLKFDKKGNLYVVDAYYGVYKVNIATKEFKNIINITKPIDGKKPIFPNSIDVAENGDLYWTITSTDFPLYQGMHTLLSNPTGSLMRYNAAEKKNEVLLQDFFLNGVQLSDDETFVIVSDFLHFRILKYYLKGPKAGQYEIFIENIPGYVDNIHSDGHGGFLLAIVFSISPEHPSIIQSLAPHPYIRKMLSRLFFLVEMPFQWIHRYYPNIYAEKIVHWVGSFAITEKLDTMKKSMVLRLDASGNILDLISSDNTDVLSGISSAYIHNGYLWLGSPWNNHVSRVPLKQAFPDLAVDDEKASSRVKNEKQPSEAAASEAKAKRVKRDTDSAATAKPVEPKLTPKKTASSTTPKPTAASAKPTPASTTTPKPTAAPKTTTPKPTAAPKAAPKAEKPTTADSKVKSSETKQTSKSTNAETKNDAKTDTKSNSPKPETNDKTRENTAKTNTKSGKNVKVEQDATAKAQKVHPKK